MYTVLSGDSLQSPFPKSHSWDSVSRDQFARKSLFFVGEGLKNTKHMYRYLAHLKLILIMTSRKAVLSLMHGGHQLLGLIRCLIWWMIVQ